LLITSSMIAAKFLDDDKISNKSYAQIGGIKNVSDLNLLEIEFLQVINYSLMCDRETFEEILALLEDDDMR
jgi:hypothetical protein